MKLFISHSSADAALVKDLAELVRAALRLSADEIRCTSVEGHKLPGGAKTDETLRREVDESEAFIGVISPRSLESMYVTFELGARWGAGKHLLPVLTPGVSLDALPGPLSGINALRCDERGDLHKLVEDLSNELSLEVEKPTAYLRHVTSVLRITQEEDIQNEGNLPLESFSGSRKVRRPEQGAGIVGPENNFPNVFDQSDEGVVVIASVPGTSDKQKIVNLTYLYLLGKEQLLDESRASFEEIRQVCKRHACYNGNNFASYVKAAQIVCHGSGRSLSAELTHPGRNKAKDLASRLNEEAG